MVLKEECFGRIMVDGVFFLSSRTFGDRMRIAATEDSESCPLFDVSLSLVTLLEEGVHSFSSFTSSSFRTKGAIHSRV